MSFVTRWRYLMINMKIFWTVPQSLGPAYPKEMSSYAVTCPQPFHQRTLKMNCLVALKIILAWWTWQEQICVEISNFKMMMDVSAFSFKLTYFKLLCSGSRHQAQPELQTIMTVNQKTFATQSFGPAPAILTLPALQRFVSVLIRFAWGFGTTNGGILGKFSGPSFPRNKAR